MAKTKKSSHAMVLTTNPPRVPSPTDPKHQTIYEVVCIRECRESFREIEQTIGRYVDKGVAEFRMNGAKMFAQIGDTTRYFIREANLILDTDVQVFLSRAGKGLPS